MTNPLDYFVNLSIQQLLICKSCKYALQSNGIITHLRREHKATPLTTRRSPVDHKNRFLPILTWNTYFEIRKNKRWRLSKIFKVRVALATLLLLHNSVIWPPAPTPSYWSEHCLNKPFSMSHPHGTRSKQVEKIIDSLNRHIQSDMPIGNLFSVKLTLQRLSVVAEMALRSSMLEVRLDSTRLESSRTGNLCSKNSSRAGAIARSKISSSSRADSLARSMFDSKCSKCSKKSHIHRFICKSWRYKRILNNNTRSLHVLPLHLIFDQRWCISVEIFKWHGPSMD